MLFRSDRIIPRDETGPGAVESGAVDYIDRSLAEYLAPEKAALTKALGEIEAFAAQSQGERSAPALMRPGRVGESIEIVPVPGDNEISVTAFNRNNTVQSRIHATRFSSSRVAEPPRVFVLAIGIDRFRGKPEDSALAYAVKDAQDMAEIGRAHV